MAASRWLTMIPKSFISFMLMKENAVVTVFLPDTKKTVTKSEAEDGWSFNSSSSFWTFCLQFWNVQLFLLGFSRHLRWLTQILLHFKCTSNPKGVWKTLKKLLPKPSKVPPNTLEIDSTSTSSQPKIAEHFNSYFATIGTKIGQVTASPAAALSSNTKPVSTPSFKFKPIETATVLKQLKSLKTNKATRLDNIPTKLLKTATPRLTTSLAYIFNLSLSKGVFPREWKVAKVSPLHKSGSRNCVENYRPIFILPVVAKIFEREVHKQLFQHLVDNDLLHPCQHGFRPKRSTHTALIRVVDDWM